MLHKHLRLFAAHMPGISRSPMVTGIKLRLDRLTSLAKLGLPTCEAPRVRRGFILSYDRRHRNPNWVMEHLTSDAREALGSRGRSKFLADDTVHGYFRVTPGDYRGSGYDRGHLAAADDHRRCQPDLDDTFVLTNVAPQNEYLNRGTWKRLERHVRNLVLKYGSVYVCSGPLYLPREIQAEKENEILRILECLPDDGRNRRRHGVTKKYVIYEVIGDNDVAVPTHFFKVVVAEAEGGDCDMEAYIVPNRPSDAKLPLSSYMVPRDTVERAAGFLLFHQLPSSTFRRINGKQTLDFLKTET